MSIKKNKIVIAITLAIVSALLLGGVSFTFFPSQLISTTQSTTPNLAVEPFLPATNSSGQPTYSAASPLLAEVFYAPPMTTTIAIESDGSVNSTVAPIQRIGDIYTLTGNIVNETISIQKDNIVLNGDGYTIEGFSNGFAYAYEAIDLQNVTNVTVENFNVDSFWQPIQAHDSLDLQIKANNLTNCASIAISFDSCNNSVISGNILEGTIGITNIYGDGESTNNTIIGNSLFDVAEGIQISGSSYNVISGNTLTDVYDNIGVDGNSSVISNNIMINGIEGIFAGGDTSIFGNTIYNMTDIGLAISGQNDKVYENTVENAKYAVCLQTSGESENTVFYHNNFINDTQNVQVDQSGATVLWDNGKEGNYWSSYNGTGNSDGIGATPYNLGGNNIDLYPLLQPYVPQSAIVDYSMGRLFFILAIITVAAGAIISLCVYFKYKTHS